MRAVIYLRSRRRSRPKRDLTPEGFSTAAQREARARYDAEKGPELVDEHAHKAARGHDRRNRHRDLTLLHDRLTSKEPHPSASSWTVPASRHRVTLRDRLFAAGPSVAA
jgi:hypothetical protein